MLTKKQERLAQRIVDALVAAQNATGDARAARLREAAGYASDLRMTFATSQVDDRPDVRGRSYGYRTAMADIFNKADVGQEIRSAFRYHVNIVHKERVPAELLAEFGVDERTRLQQMEARRQSQQAAAAVGRAQQVVGALSARGGLRPLMVAQQQLATVDASELAEMDASARETAHTLAKAISAVAAEVVRVTK